MPDLTDSPTATRADRAEQVFRVAVWLVAAALLIVTLAGMLAGNHHHLH
jgi:uncharacterized MAPEG superfamily protein